MKRLTLTLTAAILAFTAFVRSAAPTEENGRELVASADFNNDGEPDVVIADKDNGQVRVALGQAGGGFAVSGPQVIFPKISGLTVGRIFATNRVDALLLEPQSGLSAVRLSGTNAFSVTPFHPMGIGPSKGLLARLTNAAGYEDAVLSTVLNNAPDGTKVETLRNAAGNLKSPVANGSPTNSVTVNRMLPVLTARGSTNAVVGISVGSTYGASTLQLHDASDGAMNVATPDATLAMDGNYSVASGFFGPALQPRLIVLKDGMLYAYKVVPSPLAIVAGVANAAPDYSPQIMNPGNTVASVTVVPGQGAAPDRLLLRFTYGTPRAALYDYTPGSPLTLAKALSPSAASTFTGAVALANGEFVLLEGATEDGVSSSLGRYDKDGKFVASTALPSGSPLASRGNVIFFNGKPLADPFARIVGAVNAGDWSSGVSTNSPLPSPNNVTKELFLGAVAGLGSASVVSAGSTPAGATHALGSQFADDVSYFNYGAASGPVTDTVTASPAGGHFSSATEIELTSAENARLVGAGSAPDRAIYYRFDANSSEGTWAVYNASKPPVLIQNGTLLFYSTTATGLRSPMGAAEFTFESSGSAMDSDGDGVPDYVEQAYGLDPTAGADTDGDGDSDLAEIAAGTDPSDPADYIARGSDGSKIGTLNDPSFMLRVYVNGRDGTGASATNRAAASNVVVSVKSPVGSLLGSAPTHLTATTSNALADVRNVVAGPTTPYLAAFTPQNFKFNVKASTNYPTPGREMVVLVDSPQLSSILPESYFGGGDISSAATNWVSMLRANYLPTNGTFVLSEGMAGGVSVTNAFNVTAAALQAALNATHGGAGWMRRGPVTVTGAMPRFVVSQNAPTNTGLGYTQANPDLEPRTVVALGEKQRADTGKPLIFEIVFTPGTEHVYATNSVPETLTALLVERKLESLLGETNLTLLPGRAGDESRVPLNDTNLTALKSGGIAGVPAYTFAGLRDPIRDTLAATNSKTTNTLALLQLADAVYESSSRTKPADSTALTADQIAQVLSNTVPTNVPPAVPMPIDTLRTFIRTGTLATNVTGITGATRTNAFNAVVQLLASSVPRPEAVLTLTMGHGGMFEIPAEPPSFMATPYHLLDASGATYNFNGSVSLRPGTRIVVTGYSDVTAPAGSYGQAIEVKSVALLVLPTQMGADADGNLLADAWEQAFYGAKGQNPQAIGAGGKSLVQLYLDGADPMLGSSTPVADLFPRNLRVNRETNGNYTMRWRFPGTYAEAFNYELQSTLNLTNTFGAVAPADLITTAGDDNELPLGLPSDPKKQFWRLKLHLNR
jgi:hypothetical protein